MKPKQKYKKSKLVTITIGAKKDVTFGAKCCTNFGAKFCATCRLYFVVYKYPIEHFMCVDLTDLTMTSGSDLKGIYTRLLSGQTGNQSIFVGFNCLQVRTGDQRNPVVVLS